VGLQQHIGIQKNEEMNQHEPDFMISSEFFMPGESRQFSKFSG